VPVPKLTAKELKELVHLMSQEDWDIFLKAINKELKRRKNVQVDTQLSLELKEIKDVSGDSDPG